MSSQHRHHRQRRIVAGARRRSLPGSGGVWALNLALVLIGLALWLVLRDVPAPPVPVRLPWLALAAAFALTEVCVVHIHLRRSAFSVTLGEIPLVIGLLFCSPTAIVSAWVLGSVIVLAVQRGQPKVRAMFNFGQIAVSGGLAAAVFHLLSGGSAQLGPAAWGAAAAGALAATSVASLLVLVALALSGERVRRSTLLSTAVTVLMMAPTNASIGLAAAAVLAADARAGLLLLAPVAAMFIAYRAYTAERVKHTTLEFLYEATLTLTRAGGAESGLAGMLAMARETFRAEIADACVFPTAEHEEGSRVALAADGHVAIDDVLAPRLADALREFVAAHPNGALVSSDRLTGALADHLRAIGARDAMIAPLPGDDGILGGLIVANRTGAGGGFGRDDLRLFDLLAHHVGASLAQTRLGRQVHELRDIGRHLEHQAFHDPLTGLANRLLFVDRIGHALSRREGSVTLIYIDLDDFKAINDTLGHDAGDALLQETARRLLLTLRAADTAARLGGDEFAVLLIDLDESTSRVVADRILDALRVPFLLAGSDVAVHASLGVAITPSGTIEADELLRNADVAMYASKHGGKSGYSVYQQGMAVDPEAAVPRAARTGPPVVPA